MPEDINKYPLKVEYPEIMWEMQKEILNNHPQLWEKMQKMQGAPLEEKIAVIATYCNVLVDGWFTEEGLVVLFDTLMKKLKERSTIVLQ